MAIYCVWVEVTVDTTDEPGDTYVPPPEAEYIKLASYRDAGRAKRVALACVAHLEAIKQPPREAARARSKRRPPLAGEDVRVG